MALGGAGKAKAKAKAFSVYVSNEKDNTISMIDSASLEVVKCLLVGQRVWRLAFTPDKSPLFTTNGVSNDVSVIDVARLKVVKSIAVGRFLWA